MVDSGPVKPTSPLWPVQRSRPVAERKKNPESSKRKRRDPPEPQDPEPKDGDHRLDDYV